MENKKPYLGSGWAFPPRFIHNRWETGVEMVSGEADIQQSLHILFATPVGHRVYRWDYGHVLDRWVFHGMDLTTRSLMEDSIRQAVLNHEPRITLEEVVIALPDEAESHVSITLHYMVKKTNSRSNFVFPFYLKERTIK